MMSTRSIITAHITERITRRGSAAGGLNGASGQSAAWPSETCTPAMVDPAHARPQEAWLLKRDVCTQTLYF